MIYKFPYVGTMLCNWITKWKNLCDAFRSLEGLHRTKVNIQESKLIIKKMKIVLVWGLKIIVRLVLTLINKYFYYWHWVRKIFNQTQMLIIFLSYKNSIIVNVWWKLWLVWLYFFPEIQTEIQNPVVLKDNWDLFYYLKSYYGHL